MLGGGLKSLTDGASRWESLNGTSRCVGCRWPFGAGGTADLPSAEGAAGPAGGVIGAGGGGPAGAGGGAFCAANRDCAAPLAASTSAMSVTAVKAFLRMRSLRPMVTKLTLKKPAL